MESEPIPPSYIEREEDLNDRRRGSFRMDFRIRIRRGTSIDGKTKRYRRSERVTCLSFDERSFPFFGTARHPFLHVRTTMRIERTKPTALDDFWEGASGSAVFEQTSGFIDRTHHRLLSFLDTMKRHVFEFSSIGTRPRETISVPDAQGCIQRSFDVFAWMKSIGSMDVCSSKGSNGALRILLRLKLSPFVSEISPTHRFGRIFRTISKEIQVKIRRIRRRTMSNVGLFEISNADVLFLGFVV